MVWNETSRKHRNPTLGFETKCLKIHLLSCHSLEFTERFFLNILFLPQPELWKWAPVDLLSMSNHYWFMIYFNLCQDQNSTYIAIFLSFLTDFCNVMGTQPVYPTPHYRDAYSYRLNVHADVCCSENIQYAKKKHVSFINDGMWTLNHWSVYGEVWKLVNSDSSQHFNKNTNKCKYLSRWSCPQHIGQW